MINVIFVCLGNICRSPMAEFVFKDLVKKNGLEDKFFIQSAATSNEALGEDIHYGTAKKLREENIPFNSRRARKFTKEDYQKFDYILGMEDRNVINLKRIVGEDFDNKIYRLLDFSNKPRDIADPWYTGNFDKTYDDIIEGLKAFLEYLKKENLV